MPPNVYIIKRASPTCHGQWNQASLHSPWCTEPSWEGDAPFYHPTSPLPVRTLMKRVLAEVSTCVAGVLHGCKPGASRMMEATILRAWLEASRPRSPIPSHWDVWITPADQRDRVSGPKSDAQESLKLHLPPLLLMAAAGGD